MIGEIVRHSRFGRGEVTALESARIEIRFDSEVAPRRFAWPGAVQFLTFERPEAAERARRDVETAGLTAQQRLAARAESQRRREEQLAALHQELQRQKRSAVAKRAAANRAIRQQKASKAETET